MSHLATPGNLVFGGGFFFLTSTPKLQSKIKNSVIFQNKVRLKFEEMVPQIDFITSS